MALGCWYRGKIRPCHPPSATRRCHCFRRNVHTSPTVGWRTATAPPERNLGRTQSPQMIDSQQLLDDLTKLLTTLEKDLGQQVNDLPDMRARLAADYEAARKVGRTRD